MPDPPRPTPPDSSDAPAPASSPERRRHARRRTRGVSTLMGEVVDLSEGGVGVYQKGAAATEVGQVHELTIRHEQMAVTVEARVIRVTPMGFRRREIGLELLDPTPDQRDRVRALMDLSAGPEVSVGPRCWVSE